VEVTDVSDHLCDAGSSCSESSNLGAMVKVLALGDEEGGDSTCRAPAARAPSSTGASPRIGHLERHRRGPARTTQPCHRPHLGRIGLGVDAHRPPRQGGRHRRHSAPRELHASSASSTLCRVPHWPEKFVALDATMAPQLWIQAGLRRSGCHRRIKDKWSTARAPTFQAGEVEDTAPSIPAAMVGTGRTQLLHLDGRSSLPAGSP
jgi:hypothetical protein